MSPYFFSFQATARYRHRHFRLPTFQHTMRRLPMTISRRVVRTRLFDTFDNGDLPREAMLAHLAIRPRAAIASMVDHRAIRQILGHVPNKFITAKARTASVAIFGRNFNLLANNVINVRSTAIPNQLPIRITMGNARRPITTGGKGHTTSYRRGISFY